MNAFLKKILGASAVLLAMAGALPAQTAQTLGNLPLWFEGNSSGQFVARGKDAEFSISADGAGFLLRKTDGGTAAVTIRFIGGVATPKISGESKLAGKINYFIGNNPANWQSGISTFGKVRLADIYPGVSAIFYGNQQKLEYDLNLAAGVNPAGVGIQYEGADKLSVNSQGDLVIGLNGGEVIQERPVAYQTEADGTRHEIQAEYKLLGADAIEFAVGDYDPHLPVVIDPILGYSTYFGGNHGDTGWAIALDTSNNIYVAGQTVSTAVSNNIPFATSNAFATTFGGGQYQGDVFVAKFDSTGQTLLYCTYLGGNSEDAAYALAVDAEGHAYVAGGTASANYPTTNWLNTVTARGIYSGKGIGGVRDPEANTFPGDAFVTKLETDGSRLIYSTYLGGETTDTAYGIALDADENVFVTGQTYSTNFPVTSDALFTRLRCTNSYDLNANAFVSELGNTGTNLIYSTYLGGTNFDVGRAIAYNNGFVFVAGRTSSTNFPWVSGLTNCPILNNFTNTKTRVDRSSDAFVTVFAVSNGTPALNVFYSTFLGSTNDDVANGIAGDGDGNSYVTGWTTSMKFPNSTNLVRLYSYVRTNSTGVVIATNAFFTKILAPNSVGSTNATIGYSQMFGGKGIDRATAIALDPAGDVFIVGQASSTNFPTTDNLFGFLRTTNSSRKNAGASMPDVFVTAFKADFSGLLYSTYLGGSSVDIGNGITVDGGGNAFITGQTLSTNFPTQDPLPVGGGFRNIRNGTNDAFVAEILLTIPQLSASNVGTNLVVSWPTNGSLTTPARFPLETVTNLLMTLLVTNKNSQGQKVVTNKVVPTTKWEAAFGTLQTNDGVYSVTFDPTNAVRFFRFRSN